MIKYTLDNNKYTFDSIRKTITFKTKIELRDILLISNITTGQVLYNFACEDLNATLSDLILTLETTLVGATSTDELVIILQREEEEGESILDLSELLSKLDVTLNDILEEQRITNKLLYKIYNPE